jgi:hypothetical protein
VGDHGRLDSISEIEASIINDALADNKAAFAVIF